MTQPPLLITEINRIGLDIYIKLDTKMESIGA